MIELPFVSCLWEDAWASATDDVTLENVEETHKPVLMETRGWLLKQNEVGVSIACERCLDAGTTAYRGRSFILAGMVKSITILSCTKSRKRGSRKPTGDTKPAAGTGDNSIQVQNP